MPKDIRGETPGSAHHERLKKGKFARKIRVLVEVHHPFHRVRESGGGGGGSGSG